MAQRKRKRNANHNQLEFEFSLSLFLAAPKRGQSVARGGDGDAQGPSAATVRHGNRAATGGLHTHRRFMSEHKKPQPLSRG